MATSAEIFGPPNFSVHFVDKDTQETLVLDQNPTNFKETFGASYSEQNVRGLSHRLLQYDSSKNYVFPMEVFCIADFNFGVQVNRVRKFFRSSTLPRRGGTIAKIAPKRLLVVWPNVIQKECVVLDCDIDHSMFFKDGKSRIINVSLKLSEIRDEMFFDTDEYNSQASVEEFD